MSTQTELEDCLRALRSPKLEPFRARLRLLYEKYTKDFRATRDGSVSWALDALDDVNRIIDNIESELRQKKPR